MSDTTNPETSGPATSPPPRDPGVAILGLGTMGSAMARRLLSAGKPVHVWNRTPERAEALGNQGAAVHRQARDAVAEASVVVTMLPTGDVVRAVMIDQDVLGAMVPGAVWAQMGTIGVETTTDLDAEVQARRSDVAFVDAPVSGSRAPAESGQLVILASGPERARPVVEPVFSVLGRRTLWLGAAGMGSKLKLVLNTWLAFEVEAAAEAAALADRFAIERATLQEALDGLPLVSPFAAMKLAKMESSDYQPDFSLAWALKDLDLATRAAGSDTAPVASAIAQRWRALVEHGFGDLDVSAARLDLGGPDPAPEGGSAPGRVPDAAGGAPST